MKITTEPLESRQIEVTVEIDEERTEQAMRQAARHISREVDIPGFRRGKAPYGAILQRYGEKVLRREAANSLAEDILLEAIEEEGIESYGPGSLDDVTLDPLTFTFTMPLSPVVELGDYRDYRREMPEVEVADEDVQEELDEIRRENAVLEPAERPAALEDVVVFDLAMDTLDGETLLEDEDVEILLDAENERPAPGFAEAIVGMEVGEERTFTLTLPDDFFEEELQGQEATFTVELREAYNRILPDFDDDLARTVGPYDSFEDLEERVRQRLSEQAWQQAESEYSEQVVNDIVEQSRVEYPPYVLEEELDDLVERFEQSLKRRQHLALEDYLRFQGQTKDDLRESLKPEAEKSLKRSFVLGKVVRKEGLEVDEDEISEEIENLATSFGERADEARAALDTDEGRDNVRSQILASRAVERLVAIAKGEAPELDTEQEEPEEAGESEVED